MKNIEGRHLARPSLPWRGALAALAGLLALALNSGALRAAWSDNLAYLRLDAVLNHAPAAVTLQPSSAASDWSPAEPMRFVTAYGLGMTELAARSYAPAIAALRAALAAYPEYSGTHALLADAYHGLGDEDTAIREWRAGQALPLLLAAGGSAVQARDWQTAISWYGLATRVDPSSAAAFWQLGLAYGSAGQRAASIQALQAAVSLSPTDVAMLHALGLAEWQAGDLTSAESAFKRVLVLQPNEFYTNLYITGVELGLGQLEAAEGYGRTAIRLGPNDPRTHFALGSVYARQARWPAAIAELQAATGLIEPWNRTSTSPLTPANKATYHLLLAQTYQSAGQPALAIAEYQAVLSLDPQNAAAIAALKTLETAGQP